MMAGQISLDPMTSLPDDIAALLWASLAEGHNLVKRLVDEWDDGSNRFDRIRHLYVLREARRQGVGRSLVLALIAQARPKLRRVRLRTIQPEASLLYLALGFEETGDEPDATQVFRL